MKQLVESLSRLYKAKKITKEKILSMKISEEEKAYILGEQKVNQEVKKEFAENLPS